MVILAAKQGPEGVSTFRPLLFMVSICFPDVDFSPVCGTMVETVQRRKVSMAISVQEIDQLSLEFRRCQKLLLALGDETRQHLILEMMQIPDCGGARVNAITERTNLSRPAVSHHIGILKEAGLVKMRREGTKNYYYFDTDAEALNDLLRLLGHTRDIMGRLPDRSGEGR